MLEILSKCTLGGVSMASADVSIIPNLISTIVTIVEFAIPAVLIVLGMIDLGKAVTSNDEKQMKEAQKILIKRVVYAVLIFFVVAIVKFAFSALAPKTNVGSEANEKSNITNCIDCFVNGSSSC